MTTGPAHWELLIRARAVDNQLYVAAISPARNPESDYKAWGFSSLSNPYGELLCKAGHEEEIVYADIGTVYIYSRFFISNLYFSVSMI